MAVTSFIIRGPEPLQKANIPWSIVIFLKRSSAFLGLSLGLMNLAASVTYITIFILSNGPKMKARATTIEARCCIYTRWSLEIIRAVDSTEFITLDYLNEL